MSSQGNRKGPLHPTPPPLPLPYYGYTAQHLLDVDDFNPRYVGELTSSNVIAKLIKIEYY